MGFFDFLFGNNNGSNDNAGKNTQQAKTSSSSNGMTVNRPTPQSTTPSPNATSKPKKPLASYSMEDIYGKGFRFVVDRYEEWANQSQSDVFAAGKKHHQEVLEYIKEKVLEDEDLDF